VGMPDKQGGSTPVNAKNVLNLVLAEDNKIYWWMELSPPVVSTDYSSAGVRKLLLDKSSDNPRLIVLIKPKDRSRFQNVVDILDEMEITGTERFAIVDFSEDDRVMLQGR
ncbi:MAG TPA: biopolymer transporter ExbD, partial [Cyclobacteriaceae bacterium]|nr:biopolymer transporter ExbD [Cyclobacteriaceae bacterium]